ncbi:MAG: reverse transcriptase/maturase family protein, partial [Lactobacillus sp.]|nr:reverse transcriptase/maturase family protein [Lactobacillus sp.]
MNWHKYLKNAIVSIAKKKQDKLVLDQNKTLNIIEKYVKLKQYEYKPWMPFFQKKDDGGVRPIISPPINDRILLKALSNYCSSKLKSRFAKVDDISFAYQKGKGTRDALVKLKSLFKPGNVIVKIDIQKFFNNINKEILINLLEKLDLDEYAKSLIDKSLAPTLFHNEAYDLALESIQNGIPQGSAVSDILSNLYLLEFDETCKEKKLRLIRYADDMIIIVDNEREAYEVLYFVEDYLNKKRGLSIHPLSKGGKTAIYLLPQRPALTYLGVVFDGNRLLPSIKCQAILSNKIKSIAKNVNTDI